MSAPPRGIAATAPLLGPMGKGLRYLFPRVMCSLVNLGNRDEQLLMSNLAVSKEMEDSRLVWFSG